MIPAVEDFDDPVSVPGGTKTCLPGASVLVIGLNYWPEQTGIAPYTTDLAEHLTARGARVTVVTGMPYYPQWEVLEKYRGHLRLRETVRGVDVVRFRQHVPARQSALRRALFEGSFFLNALRSLGLRRPDVVMGVTPSLAGGVLAAIAARRYRVPYGLLFQDLTGQAAAQSGIVGGGRVARATGAVEGKIARGAAGVAVVSEGFRGYLEKAGVPPERITLLPNWAHTMPPQLPRSVVRDRLGWDAGMQIILHAGNMGLKQGLEQVIAAARLAAEHNPQMRFVLMGDGNQRSELERLATGLTNVSFLDPQPADWFPEVLHAADVLLVSQRSSVTDMALPSKLTAYFMAGQPVVAAAADSSATAATVRESGAGVVVGPEDPGALIAVLNRLAADDDLRNRLASAGLAFASSHLDRETALARAGRFVSGLFREDVLAGRAEPISRGVA